MYRFGFLDALMRNREIFVPDVVIVLGTGSDALAESVEAIVAQPGVTFQELGLPPTTNPAYPGKLLFCVIEGRKVALQVGRSHYYESGDMGIATATMRLFGRMGVKLVVLTNAVGIINPAYQPGDLLLVRGHNAKFVPDPLIGPNYVWGTRFPAMGKLYDPELRRQMHVAAEACGFKLPEVIYGQVTGPSLETEAEIEMFAKLGWDTIGMSSADQAIVARHEGMRVVGLNVGANLGEGLSLEPLSDERVQEVCRLASVRTVPLLRTFLRDLKL